MNSKILALAISTVLANSIIVTNIQAENTSYDLNTGTLIIPEVQVIGDNAVVSYQVKMGSTSTHDVFSVVEIEEIEATDSESVAIFSLNDSELYIPLVEIEPVGFIPSVEATFNLESLIPLTFKLADYSSIEEESEDDDSEDDDDSQSGKKDKYDDSSSDDDDSDSDDDSGSDDSSSSNKVTICHKGKTMEVPEPALKGHLGHGDTLNACNDDDDSDDDDSGSNDDPSPNDDAPEDVDVCHEGKVVKNIELPEINIPESATQYVDSAGAGALETMTDHVLEGHLRDVDTCGQSSKGGNGSSTDDYDVYVTPAKDAVDAQDAIDAEDAIGATDAQGINIVPLEEEDDPIDDSMPDNEEEDDPVDDSIPDNDDSSSDDDEDVTICHKGKKTMTLPKPAVAAHLGHGDTLGACEDN